MLHSEVKLGVRGEGVGGFINVLSGMKNQQDYLKDFKRRKNGRDGGPEGGGVGESARPS